MSASYLDLEERPVVVRQTFPAEVTLPDGTEFRVAQVIVTRAAVYVWTMPGEPDLAALHEDTDLAGTFDPPSRPNRVTLMVGVAGQPWVVEWTPGQGCGCHHALKAHRPFSPTRL